MERRTDQDVLSKNGEAQKVPQTTWRTELRVVDDPLVRGLSPISSVGPRLWTIDLLTGFLIPVFLHAILMEPSNTSIWPFSPPCEQPASLSGCCVFKWPACSIYAGFDVDQSDWHNAGSYWSSPGRPLPLVNESWPKTAQCLLTCVFCCTKNGGGD